MSVISDEKHVVCPSLAIIIPVSYVLHFVVCLRPFYTRVKMIPRQVLNHNLLPRTPHAIHAEAETI